MFHKFIFHQLDVKTAFLYGKLQEDIYMAVPEGVDKVIGNACKLVKSLYGLKQSPRCWSQRFNGFLMSLQFKRSMHDYCMYTRFKDNDTLILILYVDDLIIDI